MMRLRVFLSRLLDLLLRRRRDARLSEEIAAHLDLLTDAYVAHGMSVIDARLAARKAFGGVDQVKEVHRDQRGFPSVDALVKDVRYAARMLLKDRWFTASAVLVLALGIGVNTTVFTIINGMNLRDLPFDEPDEIMALTTQGSRGQRGAVSYPDFTDWRGSSRSFEGLAAYASATMNLGDEGRAAERAAGLFITGNTFGLLGEHPILGRDFAPHDERAGAEPVVMLGHAVWTNRYGATASIVGRTIRVNGVPVTVIGVMPAGFRFPRVADVWRPLGQMPGIDRQARDARGLGVFGRLRDDVSLAQARAEMSAIAAGLADTHPDTNRDVLSAVLPLNEYYVGPLTQTEPLVLLAAVCLVLLIACANVANLLLARSLQRSREIALRAALGASRGRIVRQLLVESVLLASVAGVAGLWLSVLGVRMLSTQMVNIGLPYWIRFTFDIQVFSYLAAICLGTGVLFGLAPAWHLSKTNAHDTLAQGGRGAVGGLRARRWTSVLLAAELALTIVLLAGAGLLIRSSLAVYQANQIIDSSDLLTARLTLPPQKYTTPDSMRAFYARLDEHLRALPGGATATIAGALPFVPTGAVTRRLSLSGPVPGETDLHAVVTIAIGPRYFDTLGLTLLRGRGFTNTDGTAGHETAIINQRLAEIYFQDREALGSRFRLDNTEPEGAGPGWVTIIGVSPSVRQTAAGDAEPVVYLPLRAHPQALGGLIARGPDSSVLPPLLRDAVRGLDPDLPLYNVLPLAYLSDMSRWTYRVFGSLLIVFAGIALLLSTVGLYGITAYSVTHRTQEIGVRMALGARGAQVSWFVLRGTLLPVATALVIGAAGAVGVGRVLRGLLVRTSPVDPMTFVGVVTVLLIAMAAACLLPTRRATRVDPATALRHN